MCVRSCQPKGEREVTGQRCTGMLARAQASMPPCRLTTSGKPACCSMEAAVAERVLNSAAGFSGYSTHIAVDVTLVAQVALCAVAGSFAGSRLARVVDPTSLQRAFAGFVLTMASIILVREGALVASTATAALPTTLPQMLFAVAMLGLGVFAGRASRAVPPSSYSEASYQEGEGI